MRIGIIVGDPEQDDGYKLNSGREWFKNVNNSHKKKPNEKIQILQNNGKVVTVNESSGTYVYLYYAVYYYLKHYYEDQHHFELLFSNDISLKNLNNLKNYDMIFYNFYDNISHFIVKKKSMNASQEFMNILEALEDKVYPPLKFFKIQMDKCHYYDYLKKKKFNIFETSCVKSTMSDIQIKSIIENTNKGDVFLKPVMGTQSIYTKKVKSGDDLDQVLKFLKRIFKIGYKKYVVQAYSPSFNEKEEYRMFYVGDKYQYTAVSKVGNEKNHKTKGVAIIQNDGGTYKVSPSVVSNMKNTALRAIKSFQSDTFNGLPTLLTRVDMVVSNNKVYINEIEIVPNYFTSIFKKGVDKKMDKVLGEQMKMIIDARYNQLVKKLPQTLKASQPNVSFLKSKSKSVQGISNTRNISNIPIYVLGCYRKLCLSNKKMKIRLQFLEYYLKQAGIQMSNVDLVGIFWKDDLNRERLKKNQLFNNFNHMTFKNGEIGNFLSHMYALKKFLNTNKPYAIILEDDVHVKSDFKVMVNNILKRMKNTKWDIIWLENNGWREYNGNWENLKRKEGNFVKGSGIDLKKPSVLVKGDRPIKLYRMKKNFIGSTAAYIVTRRMAEYFLSKAYPIGSRPTNVFMQSNINKSDFVHYSVSPAQRITRGLHVLFSDGPLLYADTTVSEIQS